MRKLKVLFVSHSSELYGAELNLLDIIKGLDLDIFEPYLLCPRKSGALVDAARALGVRVEFVFYKYWIWRKCFDWRYICYLLINLMSVFPVVRIIRGNSIDIVYTNTVTVISGALAAKFTGRHHIWHIHETISNGPEGFKFFGLTKFIFYVIYWLSQDVVVNSKFLQKLFPSTCEDKIKIIYNSFEVESDLFSCVDKKNIRMNYKDYGIVPESKIVGVVGGFSARKNQEAAILAMTHLLKKFPETKLVLFGQDSTSGKKYEVKLRSAVERLELSKNVIFAGYVSDLQMVYGVLDILLVPSSDETFGRVIVEAMLFNVPVVAASVGGIPEIIEHGKTGLLCDMNNPDNIANILADLLSAKYDLANITDNAYKFVKSKFSSTKMQSQIKDCLLGCA